MALGEAQASPLLLSVCDNANSLGHKTQLPWEPACGGCARVCVWLPLSGHGTCQQNCKRREFKPQLETSLPRGAAEEGKDPGVGMFQKLARAWGFSEAGALM